MLGKISLRTLYLFCHSTMWTEFFHKIRRVNAEKPCEYNMAILQQTIQRNSNVSSGYTFLAEPFRQKSWTVTKYDKKELMHVKQVA